MCSKNIQNSSTSSDVVVTIAGSVTEVNGLTGAIGIASGAGTAVTTNSGSNTITVSNTGVTSAVAGTNIGVSSATGAVTITNTAPTQSVVSGNAGIIVTTASGVSTVSVNAGLAGAIVEIEDGGGNMCKPSMGNPGLVILQGSMGGNISTSAVGNILFLANTAPTQALTAGAGITISTTANNSTISNTGITGIQIGGGTALTGILNFQSGSGLSVTYLGGTPNNAVFVNTGVVHVVDQSGTQVTNPAGGSINIVGGTGVTTVASGSTLTINATGTAGVASLTPSGGSTLMGAITLGSNGGITLLQVGQNIAIINSYALNNTSQTAAINGGTAVVNATMVTQQVGPALYSMGFTSGFSVTTGSGAVAQFFASVPFAAATPNFQAFPFLYQDPTLPAPSTTLRVGSMVISAGSGTTNIVIQPDPNSPSGLFPANKTFVFQRQYWLYSTSTVI